MQMINTPHAAQPLGHYVQATQANGTVYVSGILPVCVNGDIAPNMNFSDQAALVLMNAREVLKEAGSDFEHVLKSTVYIVGVENWSSFDAVYTQKFGLHRPARAVVPVVNLHHGFLVEVDMIAQVKTQ